MTANLFSKEHTHTHTHTHKSTHTHTHTHTHTDRDTHTCMHTFCCMFSCREKDELERELLKSKTVFDALKRNKEGEGV